MLLLFLSIKEIVYTKFYSVWCCSFIPLTNKKHSETMFFSYNLDVMHYSLLHFHFTSAYTHRVISHVLKSKRLTNC